jgi:mono/diheme cytochrome c family protein
MSAAHGRTLLSQIGGAFIVSGLIAVGCAAVQLGATPADITQARSQSEKGATVFANECAKCHGQRGEGIGNAPDVLGPSALPQYPRSTVNTSDPALSDPQMLQLEAQARPSGASWRDPFRTAQDLFNFTSTHMPKGHAADLKPMDHWAVVSFMLAVQGATLPAGGIGPANAGSVQIPRR